MSSVALPPLLRYSERPEAHETALDRLGRHVASHAVAALPRLWAHPSRLFAQRVAELGSEVAGLSDDALRRDVEAAALASRRGTAKDDRALARLFAGIREAAVRTLGLRPFDVQIVGAHVLWRGAIAEMATGEGKTVTAALCAAAAALTATPVHVVSVNDYLAGRDAVAMRPLYDFLGLGVGVVTGATPRAERCDAYRQKITYCTNKELVFDYLRDRLELGDRRSNLQLKLDALHQSRDGEPGSLLNGLHFAIVDEADSVLIDEARMPLILSGDGDGQIDDSVADQALSLARRLEAGRDWHLGQGDRHVELIKPGVDRLTEMTDRLAGPWRIPILRAELIEHALSALHLFRADEHYLVRDGGVVIIDEFTGRAMPGRQWTDGLHQMIERKEGCPVTPRRLPLARMTYQRYFRRYRRVAGMTGTARGVARELWWIYRLRVVPIPTNRPSRRVQRPDRVFATSAAKWRAVTDRVSVLHRAGAPVLLGTRTVQASHEASRHLEAAGIPHVVLNAVQDQAEAATVAAAGQPGRSHRRNEYGRSRHRHTARSRGRRARRAACAHDRAS